MRPAEPFRQEHQALVAHVAHLAEAARDMPRLPLAEREAALDDVLAFLTGTLLPHAMAEEEFLYPAWAGLVGHPDAAAPMLHDHAAIAERVERLQHTSVADVDALQQLLYELHALVSVHFGKEEDIQLPAFDAAPEVAAEVLERMGESAGHAHAH